ncbi:MAG: GDSL-type esterase/lipase family protein [bacterium]
MGKARYFRSKEAILKKNLLISFFSIILLLFGLELITRIYAYSIGKGFIEKPKSFISSFFTIYDWPAPYKKAKWYIFKKGEQIVKKKEKNEKRIICFGGSTTLYGAPPPFIEKRGAFYTRGLSYPQCLKKKLQDKYPNLKIRVLNAGGDGFSSAHTLVNLALRNVELKPDIITVYHNINDLSCNYYGKEILSDYSNKYLTFDFLTYRHRTGFWGSLMKYSFLMRFVNSRTGFFRFKDVDKNRDFHAGMEFFKNNLINIVAIAKANNIFPILMTQGAKKSQREDLGFKSYNQIIEDIAKKENVGLIKIADFLDDDSYFVDEVHLSSKGVEKVSSLLYDYLASNKCIY